MIARLCLCGLWCSFVLAQTQTLTGTVTESVSGAPVAHARVMLGTGHGAQGILTDAGGQFTFASVPPGNYHLIADRNGYFSPEGEGQSATLTVKVDADKKPDAVTLRLTPGAILTGTIVNENGDSIPANVHLIRRVVTDGRGKLQLQRQGSANDLGEFRIAGLAAGRYLVCVDAVASSYQSHRRLGYQTTCFPNEHDPQAASWVELRPGEVRNVGFQLTPVRMVHVSGTVDQAGPVSISVRRVEAAGLPQWNSPQVDEAASRFEILGLSDGEYVITATADRDGQMVRATRSIAVGNDDIKDLKLVLRPGAFVSGTVKMVDRPAVPNPAGPNQVNAQFNGGSVLSIYAGAGGDFKQPVEMAGEFSLAVLPPPGWNVRSARQGGLDLRDRTFRIEAEGTPEPIEIVLAQGGGTIAVTLADASVKVTWMVVLLRKSLANDEWVAQGQAQLSYAAAPLKITSVPAGEYLVFAWPVREEVEYLNPEWIQQHRSFGQSVSVLEGETAKVTVKPVQVLN